MSVPVPYAHGIKECGVRHLEQRLHVISTFTEYYQAPKSAAVGSVFLYVEPFIVMQGDERRWIGNPDAYECTGRLRSRHRELNREEFPKFLAVFFFSLTQFFE